MVISQEANGEISQGGPGEGGWEPGEQFAFRGRDPAYKKLGGLWREPSGGSLVSGDLGDTAWHSAW